MVGGGGREHALCVKLARSRLCTGLVCAPGNPGIGKVAELAKVAADDVPGLVALARLEKVDLVVVGPEKPLTLGLADALAEAGIPCFGPKKAAAELEGSKAFAKGLMQRAGIPTAAFGTFEDAAAAKAWARGHGGKVAVKADGLAAGKGVVVCDGPEASDAAIDDLLVRRTLGAAGARLVVEERLEGEEASVIALCDGTRFLTLPAAQDHKRAFDGDQGPNTGGMGAYSPAPVVTAELLAEVEARVLGPALRQLAAEGRPFVGALYAGLMIGPKGPQVIEFNARLGDPECQVILARVETDLLPALAAAAAGDLRGGSLEISSKAALTVVIAAEGYPGAPAAGDEILGLDAIAESDDLRVLHAGTALDGGRLVTAGGRVLGVTARGDTVAEARARAYDACAKIRIRGAHYRRDIAHRALAREPARG